MKTEQVTYDESDTEAEQDTFKPTPGLLYGRLPTNKSSRQEFVDELLKVGDCDRVAIILTTAHYDDITKWDPGLPDTPEMKAFMADDSVRTIRHGILFGTPLWISKDIECSYSIGNPGRVAPTHDDWLVVDYVEMKSGYDKNL